jgi:peroxiredoxin Q/BCP
MVKVGQKAPEFSGETQNGKISLSDYKGKKVVLYFYPKDDTPGCTANACNFRDNFELLTNEGLHIIGVSPNTMQSHDKFANKYSLPFPLIADTDKSIAKSYGVWGLKKFMGREYEGILRTTFIIDEQGNVLFVIDKVDTKNSSKQILALLH